MSGVPGKELNAHQVQLIAVCTLCLISSTTVVGLRFFARHVAGVKFWWDDCAAIVALLVSWIPNVFTLIGIHNGLGRHISEVDPHKIIPFGISFWIHEITWALSIGLTIETILLFYVRLFPHKWMGWMRWSIFGLGFWTAAWTTTIFLVMVLQCRPIAYFWNPDIDGKCFNSNAMYFSSGLTSALTILAVLLLPLPIIYKLQTSRAKRFGLAFSFSAGIFILATSIIRLIVLFRIDRRDLTYSSVMAQLWSCVEASFGIVSACIPSLTPLFYIMLGKQSRSRRRSAESRSPSNSRRRSSGLKYDKRKSGLSDLDHRSLVEIPNKALDRDSMASPKPMSPDEELFKEIDDMYPDILFNRGVNKESESQVEVAEKSAEICHVPDR